MSELPPPVALQNLTTLTKPLLADYIYCAHYLPEDQRRQWVALWDGKPYDSERLAIMLASRPGPKWALVEQDGKPVCIGGYDMIREGVWQDFLIGSVEGWQNHWRSITKHCRRVMDVMLKTEAWRLQTVSLADRTRAHQWYRTLGLEYEGTLRAYGANGEDCFMFSRITRPTKIED